MKGSAFVFDSVDLLRYKLHEISLNRGGSYIDYPKWLKNEKTSINPKNTSSMLQHFITNYEQIKENPQRVSKIKLLLINIIEQN